MKWIKARERVPMKSPFAIKIIDIPMTYSHGRMLHTKQQIEDVNNGNYYPLDQIEWLDESTEVDDAERSGWQQRVDDLLAANKVLQEDNYRLRTDKTIKTNNIMEEKILKLKLLNAAYIAALEFDYCPDSKKAKKVIELFETGVTDKQLKEALDEHQGRRPDELAGQMSDIIKSL